MKVHLSFLWGGGECDNLCRWERRFITGVSQEERYNAKRGGNVDVMGILTSKLYDGLAAPTLHNPMPVGTVVKRKQGKLLADLA